MEFKLYILKNIKMRLLPVLFFLLGILSIAVSQNQTVFGIEVSDWVGAECNSNGPSEYIIPVSGLPTTGWTINHIYLQMNREPNSRTSIYVVSPNGYLFYLGRTEDGSFSSVPDENNWESFYIQDCNDLPVHDQSPLLIEGSFNHLIRPEEAFPDFSNIDLNGDWNIVICNRDANVYLGYLSIRFTSIQPEMSFDVISPAADCQSRALINAQVTTGPCSKGFYYYSSDGYNPAIYKTEQLDRTFHKTNLDLNRFPNDYILGVGEIDENNNEISGTYTEYEYRVVASDYSSSGADHTCPQEITLSPGNHDILQPTYLRNCDIILNAKLEIMNPEGALAITIDPFNFQEVYSFDYTSNGTYTLNWTIQMESLENGNLYDANCSQNVMIDANIVITFDSELCSDPNPKIIDVCALNTDAELIPISISNLPSNLSGEYGLRSVFVEATIDDGFAASEPYVDLVDPNGVKHRLFNPATFPQYDHTSEEFKVNITTCNSPDIPGATDNVPYVENGTYRPMVDLNLNAVNQSGLDPNGTWYLSVCGGSPKWSLNCFSLDFGPTCSTITEESITFGGTCTPFVQINSSDIITPFCDDRDGDGTPDYYIRLDGGPISLWDETDHLKMETTDGMHSLEFGSYRTDENGNSIYECSQFFDISVPALTPDTENPVFSNCPSDQTLQIQSNNQVQFDITYPSVTDNCDIVDEYLEVTYLDGTTDLNGLTMYTYTTLSGTTTFTVQGAGRAEFKYVAVDASGNMGTCEFTMTFVDDDPCVNDISLPVINDCPTSQTIQQTSTGEVNLEQTDPSAIDNCDVVEFVVTITFSDGALDVDNNTGTYPISPGSFYSYTIGGTGTVTFDWKATDAAGNSTTCQTVITITEDDACSSDMEAPEFINCPSNQAIVLDSEGNGLFSNVDPTVTDNCQISTRSLEVTYLGGATDINGLASFTTSDWVSDPTLYTVIGSGTVKFEYTATDAAGNLSTCESIVTVVGDSGPCLNDIEIPQVVNCPENETIDLVNGMTTIISTVPDFTDNCAIANIKAILSYSGGTSNVAGETDRVINNIQSGKTANLTMVGAGKLTINFVAEDPNGNETVCTVVYTSVIPGTDALINIASACAVAGQNITLPVTVTRFNEIGAFSFDLEVPSGSGLSFVGLENMNLNTTSFNILGNGDLRISWDEPNGTDLSLENNYRIFNIIIAADNTFSQSAVISGKELVILSDINDSGSFSGGNICVGTSVTPKGHILSPIGDIHENVEVKITVGDQVITSTVTDSDGVYSFDLTNDSYTIHPQKNDEVRSGVSILDVARIRRHFLQKLLLTENYQLIAADVNKDGKINVLDVAYTNRVFLRKRDDFPNNTAWRFFPTTLNVDNALDVNHPNYIRLLAPNLDYNNLDFVSIKTGDVDYSALNELTGGFLATTRSDVDIVIPDTIVSPSNEIRIPVRIAGGELVSALSMNLMYDVNALKLVKIESSQMKAFGGGNYNDLNGEVLIGWDHPNAEDFEASGDFMTLVFESIDVSGTTDITIEDAKFYDVNFSEITTSVVNGSITFMTTGVNDLTNNIDISATPNPFINSVKLNIEATSPQQLSITFSDITGRTIKEIEIEMRENSTEVIINDLDVKGVIFVLVEGDNFRDILKLISL